MSVFLAIDLGAGSGRVIAGIAREGKLELEEMHRFDNPGTDLPGGSHWNIVGLFRDILEGLRRGVKKYGSEIVSIGIDTWAVDFGLLDRHGRLLGMPHQYRDPRHEGMPAVMHALMPEAEIYSHTGITTNFYNTSLHLMAEKELGSPALAAADSLLFIPDLLAYWLSGVKAVERTNASTSQLLDAATGEWSDEVIAALGLPRQIFGKIVAPGTVLGPIRKEVAREIGMENIPVVAGATQDTAAAVAGIPMEGDDALWLSSGTWSIMGMETREPIRTPAAFEARFCNELGVEGTVRFLKNIAGLWLIQECKRQWNLDGETLSYGEMAKLAAAAPAFSAFIDPDDPVFASPGDMPEKIRAWCGRTGQPVPADKGTILRIASESLALKYRVVFENFCALSGRRFERLHAGGGGIQNAFLAQATADALGIEVVAGPIEATSCGNILLQMIATGQLPDLAAGRALVRRSFDFQVYEPHGHDDWQAAYQRFKTVIAR
ncbi:rhamnulokinase family protein [Luteolibacter sp. Populi]|uniref:rhamnulokinase n=1 Tax=Luteolibacter sp. Populi TaxID=3230487 RepID=UPI003465AF1A